MLRDLCEVCHGDAETGCWKWCHFQEYPLKERPVADEYLLIRRLKDEIADLQSCVGLEYESGYQDGYEEGHEDGHAEGYEEGLNDADPVD